MKWAYGKYGPFFLLGDLNMGMLLVTHELSCRELTSDVLAYYPWTFTDSSCSGEKVGLDSCCILYVGGDEVESRLSFSSSQIPKLLSAARGDGTVTSDWGVELHSYRNEKYGISCSDHQWSGDQWSGPQWSGQSWSGHQWSDQKWKKKTW